MPLSGSLPIAEFTALVLQAFAEWRDKLSLKRYVYRFCRSRSIRLELLASLESKWRGDSLIVIEVPSVVIEVPSVSDCPLPARPHAMGGIVIAVPACHLKNRTAIRARLGSSIKRSPCGQRRDLGDADASSSFCVSDSENLSAIKEQD